MRKYRLKKDTPTIKAGTIFQRETSKYDESCELMCATSTSSVAPIPLRVDDIINFDEWFEEVKEFEEWEPEHGEKYKVISDDGSVSLYCREDDEVDSFNFSIGNCYPLDTPDEVIIKEQKLIPQAMHRLRMIAKKAWFEFNGSEGPDWENVMQDKYYIYYGHSSTGGKVHIVDTHSAQVFGCVYFPTEKSAQAYIDTHEDDLCFRYGREI